MKLISALACFVAFAVPAFAVDFLESNALNLCMESSNFTATYFHVKFYPNNNSLEIGFDGVSQLSGKVIADLTLTAYGYKAYSSTIDPCSIEGMGMCPMASGPIDLQNVALNLPGDTASRIPGIAYTVPDLDANVRIVIKTKDTDDAIACVEASLSNGKTVYQAGVGWATAIISGLGLAASAITSGLGYSNAAAHVAANALSLFGFMQSQAIIGMTSVHMPPIVESWTQDFQWSMGIIRVGFLQTIATWYQRATGGTPSTVLDKLTNTSVEVLKREVVDPALMLMKRATGMVLKRSSGSQTSAQSLKVVRGIDRVGFRANMEETNIFLTGLIFYVVFVCLIIIIISVVKVISDLLVKHGHMKTEKFQDFRRGWKVVTRGILFRMTLIGFPQMVILCLWEFTQRDSPAEVVLAVVMLLSMLIAMGWAAQKVIRLAKRSVTMHKNPAYILYSDPACLNKWGFLYVQYRATAYYFVVPFLVYVLVKGMFIGLSQPAPVVQTIALVVIEASMLVAVCVLRPWMDKKTNVFNIAIAVVNFINAIFLLVFSNVFDPPGLMIGVMGVVFFVYNAAFCLVLMILVMIASVYAVLSKNPDVRYQPMRDDRGSFIKSQTQLNTELDALRSQFDATSDPFESDSSPSISSGHAPAMRQINHGDGPHAVPLMPSNTAYHGAAGDYEQQRSVSPLNEDDMSSFSRGTNNASTWQRGAGYEH
ncbi:hypothetical protein N7470_000317 [Penicillium chermesinum]|nr:hypothetical protein N7470_000317 [Penicillium chermesinum]